MSDSTAQTDYSSCGVGFVASLNQSPSHLILQQGLRGLLNLEHRGGADESGNFGDGAGIMLSIPFEFFGLDPKQYAVAFLFGPKDPERFKQSLNIFEQTFGHYDLAVSGYREVPFRPEVLDARATTHMPRFIQAFIKRPAHCRTMSSFDELLYMAKQMVRTKQTDAGITNQFFFASLSSRTIIYKALCTSSQLPAFYPDLLNPAFTTNFALFHRRFSTNTLPTWDKVQPFRLIAHNGEINTIEGNLTAAISRERALGLAPDQIVTHSGTSDTGNLNNMVEALKYRSSIPHLNEIMAILIPPANWESQGKSDYFKFWSRAMEPWDGPALVAYCDGKRIGARLDRSGFRPCRWYKTRDHFYLSSEAGAYDLDPALITDEGTLHAGRSVNIHMFDGTISFHNPDQSSAYRDAHFDARLEELPNLTVHDSKAPDLEQLFALFGVSSEEVQRELSPTLLDGKEPIGSMGDTATLAALSSLPRLLYDYFYQGFAQVTNPPLDYIREKNVVDTTVILGRKPNIFEPKEMIPPHRAYSMEGVIMNEAQLAFLQHQERVAVATLPILFPRDADDVRFAACFDQLAKDAARAIQDGATVLVLSDREATAEMRPLPALLALRAVHIHLNQLGVRLKTSIVIDTGEVRNAHQLAVMVSFGASAVCPYLVLSWARQQSQIKKDIPNDQIMMKVLNEGLLKIMAKRGISVIRSYQGSQLFSIIGFDEDFCKMFFPKHAVILGGMNIPRLRRQLLERSRDSMFLYKEHAGGKLGEQHALTARRARQLHELLHAPEQQSQIDWQQWAGELETHTFNLRDLLELKTRPIDIATVESEATLMKRFGTGAMSFGSISAEAQRDLILAFKQIGGRSNSGEGGENPFYYSAGISASIKQLASGRFGVTAEYLTTGNEVQIKVAQGAKPGEGGQLMGPKVSADIARARHATVGVSLISPPPHHDIYSIEDLKQLIFEIKQLRAGIRVSVKLVSGANIGAIALGVVKAGADIIHISGGSGGTGAASLLSMKHAGLPFEIGLLEVHRMLTQAGLRHHVTLRADGGLFSGLDVIKAALLGAEEFDFGKILLVAEGCIMARVCEKNTCPTGIATQDPAFKARYRGRVEDVVRLMTLIASDVRQQLARLGLKDLRSAVGRSDLLILGQKAKAQKVGLPLESVPLQSTTHSSPEDARSALNQQLLQHALASTLSPVYHVTSRDRALGASVAGHFAKSPPATELELRFKGSAGQGFGVFCTKGMTMHLEGEANDSVAKSMSGGNVVIVPFKGKNIPAQRHMLVGNACLYGATGGVLYVAGNAGDRFAIRNSGATAVVHSAGLHACEYMTGGVVVILDQVLPNIAAGMSGGTLYLKREHAAWINSESVRAAELTSQDEVQLQSLLKDFIRATGSELANQALQHLHFFCKIIPC